MKPVLAWQREAYLLETRSGAEARRSEKQRMKEIWGSRGDEEERGIHRTRIRTEWRREKAGSKVQEQNGCEAVGLQGCKGCRVEGCKVVGLYGCKVVEW